jgi:hypothetical protein
MDSTIASNVIIRNKILSESNQPSAPKQLLPIDDSENEEDIVTGQTINQISDDIEDYAVNEANIIDVENQFQNQNEIPKAKANFASSQNKSQFSQSRIKTIMKMDPELSLTSKESVFIVSKATVTHPISLIKCLLRMCNSSLKNLPTYTTHGRSTIQNLI